MAILDGYYVPTRYPNSIPDSIPAKIYNEKAAKEGEDREHGKVLNFNDLGENQN